MNCVCLLVLVVFQFTSAGPIVVEKASLGQLKAETAASGGGGDCTVGGVDTVAAVTEQGTSASAEEVLGAVAVVQEKDGGTVDVAHPQPLASVEVYGNGVTAYVSSDDQRSSEVVFLPSLEEAELLSTPGPFNVIRVADFLATTVQERVLDSYYGDTACSRSCGKEGVIDVMSCLGCIALSKAHLRPFPVARQSKS